MNIAHTHTYIYTYVCSIQHYAYSFQYTVFSGYILLANFPRQAWFVMQRMLYRQGIWTIRDTVHLLNNNNKNKKQQEQQHWTRTTTIYMCIYRISIYKKHICLSSAAQEKTYWKIGTFIQRYIVYIKWYTVGFSDFFLLLFFCCVLSPYQLALPWATHEQPGPEQAQPGHDVRCVWCGDDFLGDLQCNWVCDDDDSDDDVDVDNEDEDCGCWTWLRDCSTGCLLCGCYCRCCCRCCYCYCCCDSHIDVAQTMHIVS